MSSIPHAARSILEPLACAFTRPTFARFSILLLAAIVTVGPRTVSNLLRTVDALAPGHASSYRRVFSCRRWRPWRLARALIRLVLALVPEDRLVFLAGDDTVEEHSGRTVYGKARHRDPVRSSHTHTAFRWGHRWVALAILMPIPGSVRLWALPVLVALYRSPQENARRGRRHKTPSQLMDQMLLQMLRWFPRRRFEFAGDTTYSTHALAGTAYRHRDRLTQVGKFYPDAALYGPPPPYSGKGRPRLKGDRLPAPERVVAQTARKKVREVAWYGGTRRTVAWVTGTGLWYQSGQGVAEVRWVYVEDRSGTHRAEYLFSTDPEMTPEAIVEAYTGRWNIEPPFEEVRACLGFNTTRGRVENTVLRQGPCLLCLYTVVVLIYRGLTAAQQRDGMRLWENKEHVTFTDALTAVRRYLWRDWVFATLPVARPFQKLPAPFQQFLLHALTPAA